MIPEEKVLFMVKKYFEFQRVKSSLSYLPSGSSNENVLCHISLSLSGEESERIFRLTMVYF